MSRCFHPAAVGLAAALVVSACGVPTDGDSFERIDQADVPFELASPSTTTTTTTSTTTTSTIPLVPETTIPSPMVTVDLFFLSGDGFVEVQQQIDASEVTRQDIFDLLVDGFDPASSLRRETQVRAGLVRSSSVEDGLATIDLDEAVFSRMRDDDQRVAIAQIVLTIISNPLRVGQVIFTLDGVAQNVPTGTNRTKRQVSFDDYANLIADAVVVEPPPTTSTTTTTVAPTTTSTTLSDVAVEPVEAEPAEAATTTSSPTSSVAPTTTG